MLLVLCEGYPDLRVVPEAAQTLVVEHEHVLAVLVGVGGLDALHLKSRQAFQRRVGSKLLLEKLVPSIELLTLSGG